MEEPYITVFTSTYNRKNLLERLFCSLRRQKSVNFEWLVVDDGSTDETKELVQMWKNSSTVTFDIRYYVQPHGGKHRALNKGFQLARGVYFFIVDSDDYLSDDAIAMIEKWGKEVEYRADIAGVSGLKITEAGVLGGRPVLPKDLGWVEAGNLERKRYHLGGDKAEAYKTEVLKKFLFPEFEGEYFVTEAVCWNAIAAAGYKLRWYDYPIYHCEYLPDGLTKTGANDIEGHIRNYQGFCYYIHQSMEIMDIWEWTGRLRKYNRTARVMRKNWCDRAKDLNISLGKYVFDMFIVFPFVYGIKAGRKIFLILRRGREL